MSSTQPFNFIRLFFNSIHAKSCWPLRAVCVSRVVSVLAIEGYVWVVGIGMLVLEGFLLALYVYMLGIWGFMLVLGVDMLFLEDYRLAPGTCG